MTSLVDTITAMIYTFIYNGILFAVNLWMILVFTSSATFIIRQAILPEYDTTELPLNFQFNTCQDDLSGVCSFPVAEVQLRDSDYRPILIPETRYAMTLTLSLDPEMPANIRVFMVLLRMHDRSGKVTNVFPHSVNVPKIRQPTSATLFDWLHFAFFWPFYLIGFYSNQYLDEITVDILLHKGFVDSTISPTHKLTIEMQNRYLPIERSSIKITALFGFVRYVTFYYPILSSILIALSIASILASFSALFWARRSYMLLTSVASVYKAWRYPKESKVDHIEGQKLQEITDSSSTTIVPRNKSSKLLYDPDDPSNSSLYPDLRRRAVNDKKNQ